MTLKHRNGVDFNQFRGLDTRRGSWKTIFLFMGDLN